MDEQQRVEQRVKDRQKWLSQVENGAYSAIIGGASDDEVRAACERGVDAAMESALYRATHRVA